MALDVLNDYKAKLAEREKRMREVAAEIAEDLARDTASEITVRVHRARLEAHRAKLLEGLGG